MLEIIALVFLWIKTGEILRAKGWRRTIWMQLALVVLWFGSEFLGAFAYTLYLALTRGPEAAQNAGLLAYGAALGAALLAVATFFVVLRFLPAVTPAVAANDPAAVPPALPPVAG